MSFPSPSAPPHVAGISQTKAGAYIWHLGYCGCHAKKTPWSPTCPGVQWGSCSQLTQDCNEQLLKDYPTRAADSNTHFLPLAYKRYILASLKAVALGSGFQSVLTKTSPLGHWQFLAHLQLLGTTKNKVGCLDNPQTTRAVQELGFIP